MAKSRKKKAPLPPQPWQIAVADVADAEVRNLPAENRARLRHIGEIVKAVGLLKLTEPHVKPLRGKIWEFRLGGDVVIARALYVTQGRTAWIVRAFVKKTQKTPDGEIDMAEKRAKEIGLL